MSEVGSEWPPRTQALQLGGENQLQPVEHDRRAGVHTLARTEDERKMDSQKKLEALLGIGSAFWVAPNHQGLPYQGH